MTAPTDAPATVETLTGMRGGIRPVSDPLALPPVGAGFRSNFGFIVRWLLLGGAAGAVSGFLIGGVGGRLAMFLLRFTSSDSVRGVESDDGFTIGRFSTDTIFLLALTTFLGLIVGIVCVALRSQLPGFRGAVMIVLAGGTLGASVIIKPDGIDFTRLAPLPVACALFTFIPLAATALTLLLIGRWRRWWWAKRRRTALACAPWILAVPSVVVSVPTILMLLLVGVGVVGLPFVRSAVTGRVGWTGAVALTTVVTLLASVPLVGDVAEIVSRQ